VPGGQRPAAAPAHGPLGEGFKRNLGGTREGDRDEPVGGIEDVVVPQSIIEMGIDDAAQRGRRNAKVIARILVSLVFRWFLSLDIAVEIVDDLCHRDGWCGHECC